MKNKYIYIKYLLTVSFLLITFQSLVAQKIVVESFTFEERDMTALNYVVKDSNNEKCALIRIFTTQTGLSFNVGVLGITKTEQHVGEIRLYVPRGVRKISIMHADLEALLNYDLGMALQSGRTYVMKLKTGQVLSGSLDYGKQQTVVFKTFPKKAEVLLNGLVESTDKNGELVKNLAHGKYKISVTADYYHTYEGVLVVNEKTPVQRIWLKQAFGYLSVTDPIKFRGATVYVDSLEVGKIPFRRIPITSGKHVIRISKEYYKTYEDNITIKDSAELTFKPFLDENFAIGTVTAPLEAEIWMDNQQMGKGKWTGNIEIGRHTIECRLPSHEASHKEVEIVNTDPITIACEAPKPIYGTLDVRTSPQGCNIEIDGAIVGKSPRLLQNQLIGKKLVKISKPGYKTETRNIVVEKGKVTTVDVKLTNICHVKLNTMPGHSEIYIDSRYKGLAPVYVDLPSGNYLVEVKHEGYKSFAKEIVLSAGERDKLLKLKPYLLFDKEIYGDVGYRLLSASGLSVHLGGYFHKFNLELGYVKGFGDVETFYWNSDNSSSAPVEASYKLSAITCRLGYGFVVGTRWRLTPQLGINHLIFGETVKGDGEIADGAYAVSGVLGARCNFSLNHWLGLVVTPEYVFPMKKSTSYEMMSALSSDIKNQASGFSLFAGIVVYY